MEIKATLEKPYTENQKADFIILNNRQLGYRIEETDEELQAWGYTEEELAEQREAEFKAKFFEIPTVNDGETNLFEGGWYRKQPKGYSSAVESLNTAFNIVLGLHILPANTLIFYQEPDFTDPEQCTEEWLISHQFKNEQLTEAQFMLFYSNFIQAWNQTEH